MDKDFQIYQTKLEVFERDGWQCQKCGGRADQLAHRIPQSKANIKMVMRLFSITKSQAERIIHDAKNLKASCGPCNSSFIIKGDVDKLALLERIRNEQT